MRPPCAHLAERQLLLAADGFEHPVEACAPLVGELLGQLPGLRVLAVGRRPLTWRVSTCSRRQGGHAGGGGSSEDERDEECLTVGARLVRVHMHEPAASRTHKGGETAG